MTGRQVSGGAGVRPGVGERGGGNCVGAGVKITGSRGTDTGVQLQDIN